MLDEPTIVAVPQQGEWNALVEWASGGKELLDFLTTA
jgi:hypothetical protein